MNAIINHGQAAALPAFRMAHSGIKESTPFKRFEIRAFDALTSAFFDNSFQRRDCFEIVWLKKGKLCLHVGDLTYDCSGNVIYQVAPGYARHYFPDNDVSGYYISFTSDFVYAAEGNADRNAWLDQLGDHFNVTVVRPDEQMQFELAMIAERMKSEYENYFNRKEELLQGLLRIFLIYFSRNINDGGSTASLQSRETEMVRRFLGLLKKNFIRQKMVSDYATQLFVTPNYLNRTVKKITGFTASHHIQQQIIREAKSQAARSSVSMKEIAYKLGFDNLAHFSKFFKNNCGMNFTDYKKEMQRVA